MNQRLTPIAMETRGVVADWVRAARRGHALHVDAGAALRAHVRRRVCGIQRGQGARRRARTWAAASAPSSTLRRGVRGLRRLPRRRRAREVDRGPHARTSSPPSTAATSCRSTRPASTRTGASWRSALDAIQNNGAYLQLLTPSISHLTLFMVPGALRHPARSRSRSARRSPTPRRPTPTAAPGGPRRRTASSG